MQLDTARARRWLREFDFKALFVDGLGWDRHSARLSVPLDGRTFELTAVAEKRGMAVFLCAPDPEGRIPDYPTRSRIERQVARSAHEHILVYLDGARTAQVWQWVKKEAGRPTARRESSWHAGQTGEALIQRLRALAFGLEEEETLTLPDVTGRVRAAFDLDRVTKRFYDRFKAEHAAFLEFLRGVPEDGMQRWYVSVMLNRLMFIYFVQKKGFLDGDPDYLRNRLGRCRESGGDRYYSHFLCPLFFEGFARREADRSPEINRLLGRVPYLDGGLFQRHQIEELHGRAIRIPDAAFQRLFDFFDQYRWHLDERPLRADNEINPDVLGYIFEKYINQKEMGAYYTKEDITEYIAKNTVIPFLLDRARERCRIAFQGESSVWRLLQADPDRYLYPAVRKGVELPLPPEIAAGLLDVSRRTQWNRPAPAGYALPTEIWREVVARRSRYQEVRARLADGEVRTVADLISYNLDIRQFAQDAIEGCEGPELLRAFWRAIQEITVLDPTCGSGAFLFAALNVLEQLYEACLERMEAFLEELERSGERHRPERYGDFRKVLARVAQHPNRRYFVLKSIVVNNLYGVDLMDEAVEICKLRLFLKLVAQVEEAERIEPLPDIDFNIRAGNTLVGFATREEVRRAITSAQVGVGGAGQMKLLSDREMEILERIEEKAEGVERLFFRFRQQQTELGGEVTPVDKGELASRLKGLEAELNGYLAGEYGVEMAGSAAHQRWLTSHRPFHWFVDFYGIMKGGGFDVIIGNPPYVEYAKVRDTYALRSYETIPCGNLYAFVLERASHLVGPPGRSGLIVPLSLVCTSRMEPLRELVSRARSWVSCFDMRPSSLFEGVAQRLSIILSAAPDRCAAEMFVAGYRRWTVGERPHLMSTMAFTRVDRHGSKAAAIPKLSSPVESLVLSKIGSAPLSAMCDRYAEPIYIHRIVRYFVKALDFVPLFVGEDGNRGKSEDYKEFRFTESERDGITALLNSTLFYWFWRTHSDGFHCGYGDVYLMPYRDGIQAGVRDTLIGLKQRLMSSLQESSVEKSISTRAGSIRYQEFYPKSCKSILDDIDRALAQHYGFTDEELDFIINYDIKYRMGLGGDAEEA